MDSLLDKIYDEYKEVIMTIPMKILGGFFALSAALVLGAFLHIEPFYTYLYFFSWIPFLYILDCVIYSQTRRSWFLNTSHVLWIFILSTTLWLLFEALNFRLRNWFYMGLPRPLWIRWPGYALSYATVVPGILMTADVILHHFQGRSQETKQTADINTASPTVKHPLWLAMVGSCLLVLPMIWPRFFFPLVWGAFFFLLEPYVQKKGGHSLWSDWTRHLWDRTLSLLLAGLFCGLFWEGCNFGAGAKWIYQIPFVHIAPLFEMPLLGFLGFPAFALSLFVIFQVATLAWASLPKAHRMLVGIAIPLVWILIFQGIDHFTVLSWQR